MNFRSSTRSILEMMYPNIYYGARVMHMAVLIFSILHSSSVHSIELAVLLVSSLVVIIRIVHGGDDGGLGNAVNDDDDNDDSYLIS